MNLYDRMTEASKAFTRIFLGALAGILIVFVIAYLTLGLWIGVAH